jgi:pseudaminic acid cytidylyltransferase
MITHSIHAALDSGVFSQVLVSTDDEEIARIAREHGAETPFVRPEDLSGDHTATAPVIAHALEFLKGQGALPEFACCIYATAPFVRPEYLRQGLETMRTQGCSTCFSVTTFPFPIFRGLRVNDRGCLEMIWPEHEMTRSQDLPEAVHDAGQFYWVDAARFLAQPRLYAADSRPVLLPRYLVQDIDTPEDWDTAERMFQALSLDEQGAKR